MDPNRNSEFVWRVKSIDASVTVSPMYYTNWHPNQPDTAASCMQLWKGPSYTWDNDYCNRTRCSVCELDIH